MKDKPAPQRRRPKRKRNRSRADAANRRLGMIAGVIIVILVAWFISTARSYSESKDKPLNLPVGSSLEEVVTNSQMQEWLIRYQGFTVSFNPETHQPNWVSWELLASETDGETAREKSSGFAADPNAPGCARPTDYTRSGYDRGHMAPAGDMKWSASTMNQSFLMTNICPQAGELNRGSWKKLEEKCRQKAIADSAVIIVCGPIFDAGKPYRRIGETGVAVPDKFFKVILSPYTTPPTAIGFIMPNGTVPGGMQPHAVSVDSVENLTGHDFFSALPDEIESKVEAQCDFNRWSRIRPRHK